MICQNEKIKKSAEYGLKARNRLWSHTAKVPMFAARSPPGFAIVRGVFSIKSMIYYVCKHSVSRVILFRFCILVTFGVGYYNMNEISVSNNIQHASLHVMAAFVLAAILTALCKPLPPSAPLLGRR